VGSYIVLDTEGVPTTGYAVEVAWDGGPGPLLTVPNPDLNQGGDILESHPGHFITATLGIDSYTASAPGTPGRIEEFEATASPAIGSGTIDGLAPSSSRL
jgi:hypothetical protein